MKKHIAILLSTAALSACAQHRTQPAHVLNHPAYAAPAYAWTPANNAAAETAAVQVAPPSTPLPPLTVTENAPSQPAFISNGPGLVTLDPPDQFPELTGIDAQDGLPGEPPAPDVAAAMVPAPNPTIAEAAPPASIVTGGLQMPDTSVPVPPLADQFEEGVAVAPETYQSYESYPSYASTYVPEYVPYYVPYYQPVYEPAYYYPSYYAPYTCYPWWGFGFGFGVSFIIDDHHHHDHDHDHGHDGHDGNHDTPHPPHGNPPVAHLPPPKPGSNPPVGAGTRVVQGTPTKMLPALVTTPLTARQQGVRPVTQTVRTNPQTPTITQHAVPTAVGKSPGIVSNGITTLPHATPTTVLSQRGRPRVTGTPSAALPAGTNVSRVDTSRAAVPAAKVPAARAPAANMPHASNVPAREANTSRTANVPSKSPIVVMPAAPAHASGGSSAHAEPPVIHPARAYAPPVQVRVVEPPAARAPQVVMPTPHMDAPVHMDAPRMETPAPHMSAAPAPHVSAPAPQSSNPVGKGSFGSSR